ncbi:unnamed protein product [Staurois parvus]|uniref:Uncharacterized protein n=1 Tax=Staurois parvus TaxID=386267 RepID=A0ABN9AMN2_9NEOB|nr:unnamed protein product [Staurois parvus]
MTGGSLVLIGRHMTSYHSHCACDRQSRKEPKICVQSQLITCKQEMPGTDDQCALMISVAPEVPPVSAYQCHVPVPISATSMPHISAYQCTSMPHISAHLSCLSMSPISASQCHLSVPPISAANQCHLSVPVSVAYHCQSVQPISAA